MLILGNTVKTLSKPAVCLLILILIAGCMSSAKNTETQDSIFQECPPPCWLGIEPGLTSGVEAQEILIAHYGMENVTGDQYFLDWVSSTGRIKGGNISLSNENIVHDITIWVVESTITVEQIIEEIGEPSLVYIADTTEYPGEILCGGVTLIYPHSRTEAFVRNSNEAAGVYQELYISGFELSFNELFLPTDTFKVEWDGYKDYCPTN